MRPLRLTLSAVVATLLVTAGLSTSHAAPPVGCYGLPDYPSAFLCITSFTPAEAVPDVDDEGSTVTVPRFCAGECYGPISVPVPGVDNDGGTIMILVYDGKTYVVSTNGGLPPIPPIPPIPPLPESGACPGDRPVVASVETSPYVCAHRGYDYYYGDTLYVGTCATGECTVIEVPFPDTRQIGDAVRDVIDQPTVLVGIVCDALNLYCTLG